MSDTTDDIAQLFPELAGFWRQQGEPFTASDPLSGNPDHTGVTDDDVRAYIEQRMSGGRRVGPSPIGDRRDFSLQFSSGTSGARPPQAHVEDGPPAGALPYAGPPEPPPAPQEPPPPTDAPDGQPPEPDQPAPDQAPPPVQPGDQPDEGREPPPAAPPGAPSGEGFVEIDGVQVPYSQVRSFLTFDNFLRQNPEAAQRVASALAPGGAAEPLTSAQPPPSQPSALQPPPDLDLDDPATAAIWNTLVETRQRLDNLQTGVQQTATLTQQQLRAQQEALVTRAQQGFKTRRNLNDQDLKRVSDVAAALNVLPALASPIDPITGVPRQVDIVGAVDQALEMAYYTIPEYREREYAERVKTYREDQQRRQRAGALSGSSGSTPRQKPAPRNAAEARAAMVGEVQSMMDGTWNGED